MNTITKGDFLQMVKLNHLEVLTQEQLNKNTAILKSYMEKALTSELSEVEKSESNAMIDDIGSFDAWCVLRDDFTKAIVYTRREQIAWDEPERGEFGEILKARGGVYKPTAENKKLGRVGQKYGTRGSEEDKMFMGKTRGGRVVNLGNEKEMDDRYKNEQAKKLNRKFAKEAVTEEVDEKEGGEKKDKSPDLSTSERDYLFQVVNYSKKPSLNDIERTDISEYGHGEQIQSILNKIPEVEFNKDPLLYEVPKWLKGGTFVAKYKGRRYLIDTQGYDYARYGTELV
jgi:hypothetical protein